MLACNLPMIVAVDDKTRTVVGRYTSIAIRCRFLIDAEHNQAWVTTSPLPKTFAGWPQRDEGGHPHRQRCVDRRARHDPLRRRGEGRTALRDRRREPDAGDESALQVPVPTTRESETHGPLKDASRLQYVAGNSPRSRRAK